MNKLRIKKNISFIVLTCIFLLTLTGCSTYTTSSNVDDIDKYLRKNYSEMNLEEDYIKGLSVLDNDLKKYDVFLTGERHGVEENYDIRFAFIKYLNQKAGVRYILCEDGYSISAYLNEYLETGDEEILDYVFEYFETSYWWNKEHYEFYKKLREYNETLDEDKKIILIGIDVEYPITPAVAYLKSILPEDDPPAEIASLINSFKKTKFDKPNTWDERLDYTNSLKPLQEDMKKNEDIYKEFFKDKYFDFSIVLDNIVNPGEAFYLGGINENNDSLQNVREKSIYDNFKRIYEHFPKGKYFGQFGFDHVHQKDIIDYMYNKGRFGVYLNSEDSPVKGKVLSIKYGYKDCYCMEMDYNSEEWVVYEEEVLGHRINDMNIIDKYLDKDFTLFKLNGKRSPFAQELYFVESPDGGVTTDYFQYVLIIKDSKGATPIEPRVKY